MNSGELSALLATTDPRASKRAAQLHSAPQPLSPRQAFHSRVRSLSTDPIPKTSVATARPSGELQRLSSLHVQAISLKAVSQSPHLRRCHNKQPLHSAREPDFILEERAAWTGAAATTHTNHNDDCILVPSSEADLEPKSSSLVPFGPTLPDNEVVQRPKTSRGRGISEEKSESEPHVAKTPLHSSRFAEGSMNGKSVGVSSTWQDHGQRLSLDLSSEDSDATPKASRPSIDTFASSDLAEFRPQSTTPATLKQRLSKFASNLKSKDEPTRTTVDQDNQPRRKGLRKSISTWSFHNLSDKVRFFGASASDAATEKAEGYNKQDVLIERKRKAEEAYEQQFGTKKQKANNGHSVENPQQTIRGSSRTVKKRSVSAQRTITPATRRRRDTSNATVMSLSDPADLVEEEETDRLKRPTRRELEKENQQLRALLREQKAQSQANLHLAASRSTVHLPLYEDADSENQLHSTRTRRVPKGRLQAGVPPVPPLPNRVVLATMNNKKFDIPSTESTIIQKGNGNGNSAVRRVGPVSPVRNEGQQDENSTGQASEGRWEWPEDVF